MSNAYQVVRDFENEITKWTGAKYGVAIDSCCNAIFLCLKYLNSPCEIIIPKRTYPGVAMAIINAGYKLEFIDIKWESCYMLLPLKIIDSALRLAKNMYHKDCFYCLSFHYKKQLPIGRGGMILTDDKKAADWFKMARFDGRKEIPLSQDNATICGYNMYMTPEQAARGLALFETVKNKDLSDLKVEDQNYPDLSTWRCFRER